MTRLIPLSTYSASKILYVILYAYVHYIYVYILSYSWLTTVCICIYRYCHGKSTAKLERILHCDGIWLHALRYTRIMHNTDSLHTIHVVYIYCVYYTYYVYIYCTPLMHHHTSLIGLITMHIYTCRYQGPSFTFETKPPLWATVSGFSSSGLSS